MKVGDWRGASSGHGRYREVYGPFVCETLPAKEGYGVYYCDDCGCCMACNPDCVACDGACRAIEYEPRPPASDR
jgi:hypothetical protein